MRGRTRAHYITTLNKKFNVRFIWRPSVDHPMPVRQLASQAASEWMSECEPSSLSTYRLHVIIHHSKMKILIEFHENASTPFIGRESCRTITNNIFETKLAEMGVYAKCSFTSYHGEKLPNQEN